MGPLGGLLVMDEAKTLAPSGPMMACTTSTITLASQARKYVRWLVGEGTILRDDADTWLWVCADSERALDSVRHALPDGWLPMG